MHTSRRQKKMGIHQYAGMTCVWQALLAGMPADVFECGRKPTPLLFVKALKLANRATSSVRINGALLRPSELRENEEAVKAFKEDTIHSGYFCSACDPFLILVSDVYRVNITHRFLGSSIEYRTPGATRHIVVQSDSGHMSFVSSVAT